MESANIVFKRAFLRLIYIVYPHYPLQWGCLFVYKALFVVYHAIVTVAGTKLQQINVSAIKKRPSLT